MRKQRQNQNVDELGGTRIAIWGPPSVGKDWLIAGFIKEVLSCANYHLEISQPDGLVLVEALPPPQQLTESREDKMYRFRRKNQAGEIYTYHNFTIQNDSGAKMVSALENMHSSEELLDNLKESRNIILALGIPSANSEKEPSMKDEPAKVEDQLDEVDPYTQLFTHTPLNPPEISQNNLRNQTTGETEWDIEAYYRFLMRFFSIIEGGHRNVAICSTKSDQENYRGEFKDIFRRRYSSRIINIIEGQRRFHEIELFCTSACGYIMNNQNQPNFENGSLRDLKLWQPINTAAPFFWIFERIERARWENSNCFFRGPKPASYPRSYTY